MKLIKRQIAFYLLTTAICTLTACQAEDNSAFTKTETIESVEQSGYAEESPAKSELVYGKELLNGTYDMKVDSSSSMFRITKCELTVRDGEMSAAMTMSGKGYSYLFMGRGEDAVDETAFIPYEEGADGAYIFTVPVEALGQEIECAAFSSKKQTWYDRDILFRVDSLPPDAFKQPRFDTAESLGIEDGKYQIEVALEGGSGRASVQSPAELKVENGIAYAKLIWNSPNYDYVVVDGEHYDQINTGGNSTFLIPVSGFNYRMPVSADTTVMSTPHEIEYTLYFDSETILQAESGSMETPGDSPRMIGSMDLSYAECFTVDYYEHGISLVTVNQNEQYLLTENEGEIPPGFPDTVTVIHTPVDRVYLAASSAMDFFSCLDSMQSIAAVSTKESDWSLLKVRDAMANGNITYAGKYSAPDFELLLSKNCDIAIMSTMIGHSPETGEKLKKLGIPVFTEYSSYESHPLGRLEWIRLYGLLTGKSEMAEAYFNEKINLSRQISEKEPVGKKVVFFYIASNGYVNVRKPGDYITKMIEMAGGEYALKAEDMHVDENALSTMNLQMETFYALARDADILIYNSTVDGGTDTLEQLLGKSALLKDFKAVQSGQVWCTEKNMFQETTKTVEMISDFYKILHTEDKGQDAPVYLHRIR